MNNLKNEEANVTLLMLTDGEADFPDNFTEVVNISTKF